MKRLVEQLGELQQEGHRLDVEDIEESNLCLIRPRLCGWFQRTDTEFLERAVKRLKRVLKTIVKPEDSILQMVYFSLGT